MSVDLSMFVLIYITNFMFKLIFNIFSKHFEIIPKNKTVNADYYQRIITSLIPVVKKMFPEGWKFQPDNAAFHKANIMKDFF